MKKINGIPWRSISAGIAILGVGALWTGSARLAVVETLVLGNAARLSKIENILSRQYFPSYGGIMGEPHVYTGE